LIERAEIEKTLHDDLERARALYDSETTDFHVTTEDMIPIDANYPDLTKAIRTAGGERRSALQAYTLALERFTKSMVLFPTISVDDAIQKQRIPPLPNASPILRTKGIACSVSIWKRSVPMPIPWGC
jgi:hypothetical protein